MTADIAHELRTPLTLIIGHAEAVHDGVMQPSRKTFEIIREESLRLERLVNDLRTLSLADAGELVLNIQPVALDALISEVVESFKHPAAQKGIQLHYGATRGLPKISLDGGRIIQVISNVIDNALRHSPKSGKVRIHVEPKKDNIQISIQDNGKGVANKELQNIFNRFYRVDSSRNRDSGGSGLGLAIAKSLVELYKGRIWAESNPGRGLKSRDRIADEITDHTDHFRRFRSSFQHIPLVMVTRLLPKARLIVCGKLQTAQPFGTFPKI